jgi:hypothetical protein
LPLNVIAGDLHASGRITCGSFEAPASSVGNNAIESLAGIEATKVVHQFTLRYGQASGSAVVADTQVLHIARASGTIVAMEAVIYGAIATGGDRTVTLDLLKSTAGGAFASVLSSTLVLDNTNTIRVLEAASINTDSYIADDLLQLTVAVAGAAGNQAQGLTVVVWLRENPE